MTLDQADSPEDDIKRAEAELEARQRGGTEEEARRAEDELRQRQAKEDEVAGAERHLE